MNADRIKKATKALKPYVDGDDKQSPVVDLLTDLQHYCLANGVEFQDVVRIARGHFEAETQEVDFTVRNEGTVWIFAPKTERAKNFTDTDLDLEPYHLWPGPSFVVDHRPARDLLSALQDEGFVVVSQN